MSFEDELALMHAAIDAGLGVDATFRPAAGASVACKVERFRPEPMFGLENAQARVPDELLRVLKSALPQRPKKGDVFEIGAEDLRLIEAAYVEDDDGLRWTCKVEKA